MPLVNFPPAQLGDFYQNKRQIDSAWLHAATEFGAAVRGCQGRTFGGR
jgi:hypothetical protein